MLEVSDPISYDRYRTRLITHLRWYYGDCLGLPDRVVERAIESRIARTRGATLASLLDELVGLKGKRVLDVGSGWGELVLSCRELGAELVGIEPDPEEAAISLLLLKSYGVPQTTIQGVGEELPFADSYFDLVTCQQVLEHVQDIGKVVSEIVRVTAPGGAIYISTPNYLFPYEGHYRMKWFPMTPKWLGKLILERKGRDPTFLLEHINYTNYFQLRRLWRHHNLAVRNITDELLRTGAHPAAIYTRPLVRRLALKLKLYPNISWLLTKRIA